MVNRHNTFINLTAALLVVAMLASCTGKDKKMQEMIPADAVGVMCFDMPAILEKAGIKQGGDLVIPADLKKIVEANEDAPLCQVLKDLPTNGIDADHKVYVFFTKKALSMVTLVPVDDDDKVERLVQRITGSKFSEVNGVKLVDTPDKVYALGNDVLLIASKGALNDAKATASAVKKVIDGASKSFFEANEKADKSFGVDHEVNAYLETEGLGILLKRIPGFKEAAEKFPLISIFTDNDARALMLSMDFENEGASINAVIDADKGSNYAQLLNTALNTPQNDFLVSMPSSMKYVFSMSVKGEAFAQLDQVKRTIELVGGSQSLMNIDLGGIIKTVDGPIAVGMAPGFMQTDASGMITDNWNVTIAMKTTNPQGVLASVQQMALAMGQKPFEQEPGKFIYELGDKPAVVSTKGNVVYIMVMDHEWVEGSYAEAPDAQDLFARAPVGIYVKHAIEGKDLGFMTFGLNTPFEGGGLFYTANEGDNPMLTFLKIICDIKQEKKEETIDEMLGSDIHLQPV